MNRAVLYTRQYAATHDTEQRLHEHHSEPAPMAFARPPSHGVKNRSVEQALPSPHVCWFTAPTSFANPAVTIGRAISDTYAGIRPTDVAGFVGAQAAAAVLGAVLLSWLVPLPEVASTEPAL